MTRTNFYAGYYAIYDTRAKSVYIGTSMEIFRRWTEHKRDLKNNKHKNKKLQQA